MKSIKITKYGINFVYHGDDVEYLFPWKRLVFNNRFISFGFDGVFSSLKEIDNAWADYNRNYSDLD
jgi:hypothetical protein